MNAIGILTTGGDKFYVDADDHEWILKFNWYLSRSKGLIYRRGANEGGSSLSTSKQRRTNKAFITDGATHKRPYRSTIYLARVLTNAPDDMVVGYRDKNPLNLTKSNLILMTKKQRVERKHGNSDTTSKYRGVCLSRPGAAKPWQAYLDRKYIGTYATEKQAALAWDEKAREKYGPGCYQNIV